MRMGEQRQGRLRREENIHIDARIASSGVDVLMRWLKADKARMEEGTEHSSSRYCWFVLLEQSDAEVLMGSPDGLIDRSVGICSAPLLVAGHWI